MDISRKLSRGLRLFRKKQRNQRMEYDEEDFTRLQQWGVSDSDGMSNLQESNDIRFKQPVANRRDTK